MSLTHSPTRESNTKRKQNNTDLSPFDDLALEYDAWFDREGSLIFTIEKRAFRDVLLSLPKPWLEIGVGSGRFAEALGIEAGVDSSVNLLRIAKHRGINTFLGRGEQELFDEESFGTVFLIVTLCFLISPLEVLKQANRILMPGGKLILGLVLKGSHWGLFYQAKKAQGHRFYKHATFYSYDEVVRLIVQAGFVKEKIVSTLFQRPGRVLRSEDPREGYFLDAGFTIITAGKNNKKCVRDKEVTTMNCDCCGREVSVEDSHQHLGETLCEDCYMDIRFPTKACDPWAVYSATRSRESQGLKGIEGLTDLQKAIYGLIRGKGEVTKEELLENSGIKETELQTQLATLMHCELVKGRKEGNSVYLIPFDYGD